MVETTSQKSEIEPADWEDEMRPLESACPQDVFDMETAGYN